MVYCVVDSTPPQKPSGSLMRRDKSKPYVVWSCQVEDTTLKRFAELLPMQGARSWALLTAIEKFCDLVQYSPRLLQLAHDDVQRSLHEEDTPSGKRVINLQVPTQLYNKYENLMPEWGAISWFTRRFLNAMVANMGRNRLLAEEVIESSVNELVRERVKQVPL